MILNICFCSGTLHAKTLMIVGQGAQEREMVWRASSLHWLLHNDYNTIIMLLGLFRLLPECPALQTCIKSYRGKCACDVCFQLSGFVWLSVGVVWLASYLQCCYITFLKVKKILPPLTKLRVLRSIHQQCEVSHANCYVKVFWSNNPNEIPIIIIMK